LKRKVLLFLLYVLFRPLFSQTYSFNSNELSNFKLKVTPVTINSSDYLDNVKLIEILKNNEIISKYTTIKLNINNLGEGFQDVFITKEGFIIKQSFRDGHYLVVSNLEFKYLDENFILKKYEESITDVFSDIQDFETVSFVLQKGIPMDYISDDLIYIFHEHLMSVK
jgi:hypothetical protein